MAFYSSFLLQDNPALNPGAGEIVTGRGDGDH